MPLHMPTGVLFHPNYTSVRQKKKKRKRKKTTTCDNGVNCPALKGATKLTGDRGRDANQTQPERAYTALRGRPIRQTEY